VRRERRQCASAACSTVAATMPSDHDQGDRYRLKDKKKAGLIEVKTLEKTT